MKILLAAPLYPPDIGGPATYAALLAQELPARGVTVTVVPFSLVRGAPKLWRHLWYTWKLVRAAGGVDIIYALDPISVGLPALIASRLRRRKLLLRLGGDYAWEQGRQRFGLTEALDDYTTSRHHAPRPVRILHSLQALVARRATAVIVPSHYLKRIVLTWGVKPDRLQVIYSALSPQPLSKTKEVVRQELGLSGFVITSISRLTPWKGESALISVLATLRAQGIDATLVIGGDGPYRSTLEVQAATRGVTEYVRFLGILDRTAVGDLLQAVDVYVLNSAYEGLSHQLLEAMDVGVPVIASNVGGNPELITSDEIGLLVPYNDEIALQAALVSIINEPEIAAARVEAARASLAPHRAEASLTALLGILKTL